MHRRPLVLVGGGWQSVFDQFYKQLGVYIAEKQREFVLFAKDVSTAVEKIETRE